MKQFDPKKKKILIIEDTRDSLDLMMYFLKPIGFNIDTAADGVEGLEHVYQSPPDLILLDVMLPRVNGFQVCERLKKDSKTFHIPIIMITALKDIKDKIRALEAGADDFITKPFESVELIARVKSLLRIKTYHDELVLRNQELEEQRQSLLEEEQLKEDLAEVIAHDMRNSLNIISSNVQLIKLIKDSGQAADDSKYTRRIELSSHLLLRMILTLLDISRLEKGQMELYPEAVNLPFMLTVPLKRYRELPDHSDKLITFNIPASTPSVYIDSTLFERAIYNLFDYVFRNAPDQGNVVIDTLPPDNAYLTLRVSHNGTAIHEGYREKLFEKLAQTELRDLNIRRGRGLGLCLSRLALRAPGGDISIDDGFAEGTRFLLRLPLKVPVVNQSPKNSRPATLP